jgi:hypothetical protein
MRARIAALVTVATLGMLAACGGNEKPAAAPSKPATTTSKSAALVVSAKGIADRLRSAGYDVSNPTTASGAEYITSVGGSAYDLTIRQHGMPADGTSGINLFPNHEALAVWVPLSKSFGGVAITGETWAVGLPTNTPAQRKASVAAAPALAKVLGGEVAE